MTTTKELREALNNIEPAFDGIDVGAIRHHARRVRRRHRAAGAALAVAVVAAGLVAIPHLDFRLPLDHSGAALPAARSEPQDRLPPAAEELLAKPVRPKEGPFAPVKQAGKAVDLGVDGQQAWVAPVGTGTSPQISIGPSPGPDATCAEMSRETAGSVWSGSLRDGDDGGRALLLAVDEPVADTTAVTHVGLVKSQVLDLGLGYSMVVGHMGARPPAPEPIVEVLAAFGSHGEVIARYQVLESRSNRAAELKAERINDDPQPPPTITETGTRAKLDGGELWVAPASERNVSGQFCVQQPSEKKPGCTNLTVAGSKILHTYLAYADAGPGQQLVTYLVVTAAPVTEVRGIERDGTAVVGTVLDLGSGYRAIYTKLRVPTKAETLVEIRGYAAGEGEILRSTSSVSVS